MAPILSISSTAKKIRVGDPVLIFGFLQDPDVTPYVIGNIPVDLLVNGSKVGSTITDWQGTYLFEFVLPQVAPGVQTIQTVAHASAPYGDVTSDVVNVEVGDVYLPWSNSDITDFPSAIDDLQRPNSLIPSVLQLTGEPKHLPPFFYNTWLMFAFGYTSDMAHRLVAIGGIDAEHGGFVLIKVDDLEQGALLSLPLKITASPPAPLPPYPTIYSNPTGAWVMSQSIDSANQKYYIRVGNQDGTVMFTLDTEPMDAVFWLARDMKNLLWMKTRGSNDFEAWGAFVTMHKFLNATLKTPQGTGIFNGVVGIDREWHYKVSGYKSPAVKMGQSYSAFYAMQENCTIVIWKAWDPWRSIIYNQEGLLYIRDLNRRYRFDDFTLTDTGGLRPDKYFLKGTFADGTVDITGTVVDRLYVKQIENTIFLRPIVLWNGVITSKTGETLPIINALGIGEEYRITALQQVGCFIATAAFGTPLAPQLYKLRHFRDRCLPQPLTNFYYKLSPPVAKKIEAHQKLKYLTKKILDIIL